MFMIRASLSNFAHKHVPAPACRLKVVITTQVLLKTGSINVHPTTMSQMSRVTREGEIGPAHAGGSNPPPLEVSCSSLAPPYAGRGFVPALVQDQNFHLLRDSWKPASRTADEILGLNKWSISAQTVPNLL